LTRVVWCGRFPPWPIGIDHSTHRWTSPVLRPQTLRTPCFRVDVSREIWH